MRLAAGVEYDGTAYHGWQMQAHAASVQACVEEAISHVAAQRVTAVAAGRTDAGVHAQNQVVHFDTPVQRPEHGWLLGANVHLPADINLSWVRRVSDDFHARFSATARRYRYLILNRRARSALYRDRACWYHYPLNEESMRKGAAALIGEHDFSSFRAAECQSRTPFRCVHFVDIWRRGDFVVIEIEANAFLHHMVRNIAGALMMVGRGGRPPGWIEEVLRARNRRVGGVTAPAAGLYLVNVTYPNRFRIPQMSMPWPL